MPAFVPTRIIGGEERVDYPRVYTKGDTALVNSVIAQYGVSVGAHGPNMGETIKAVNAYVLRIHNVPKAVQGSGELQAEFSQYKVFPTDIVNAFLWWKGQESTEGAAEAKEAAARDEDRWPDDPPAAAAQPPDRERRRGHP